MFFGVGSGRKESGDVKEEVGFKSLVLDNKRKR